MTPDPDPRREVDPAKGTAESSKGVKSYDAPNRPGAALSRFLWPLLILAAIVLLLIWLL